MSEKSSIMRIDKDLKKKVDDLIKEYQVRFKINITTKEATRILSKKIK